MIAENNSCNYQNKPGSSRQCNKPGTMKHGLYSYCVHHFARNFKPRTRICKYCSSEYPSFAKHSKVCVNCKIKIQKKIAEGNAEKFSKLKDKSLRSGIKEFQAIGGVR